MVVLVVASGVILVEIWAMFYRRTEVSTSKKTTADKEQDIFKNGVQLSNTCTTNPTKQQGKNNSATADEPAKKGKEKEEEEDDKDEDKTQAAEKDMDDDLLGVDAINPPSELVEAFGMIIKHMNDIETLAHQVHKFFTLVLRSRSLILHAPHYQAVIVNAPLPQPVSRNTFPIPLTRS